MKHILIAVASAVLITGTASAATVIDEIDRRSYNRISGFGTSLSFDGYQGSGPVVQVDITFRAELLGTITVVNNTDQEQTFSAGYGTISQFIAISDPPEFFTLVKSDFDLAGNVSGTIGPNGSFSVDILFGSEVKSFSGANGGFSVELFDSDLDKFTFVGAEVTPFLGPFDVIIPLISDINSFPDDSSLSIPIDFQDSFFAEVAYRIDDSVTPVPLPSALPMLLAGLGGLGLVSRRRKR